MKKEIQIKQHNNLHVISDNTRKIVHKFEKNNSKSKSKNISNQLNKNNQEALINDMNAAIGNKKLL